MIQWTLGRHPTDSRQGGFQVNAILSMPNGKDIVVAADDGQLRLWIDPEGNGKLFDKAPMIIAVDRDDMIETISLFPSKDHHDDIVYRIVCALALDSVLRIIPLSPSKTLIGDHSSESDKEEEKLSVKRRKKSKAAKKKASHSSSESKEFFAGLL